MEQQLTPLVRVLAVAVAWPVWLLPFFLQRRRTPHVAGAQIDARARWGMMLQAVGYMFIFTHGPRFWATPIPMWRAAAGAACAALAISLAWGAVRHLGRHWRVDAGLNPDHELVRSGTYRIVRHPIYSSMFWMMLAAIAWAGSMPGAAIGLASFLAGIEIRVRVEDALLRARFGQAFVDWTRDVKAYVPFVR